MVHGLHSPTRVATPRACTLSVFDTGNPTPTEPTSCQQPLHLLRRPARPHERPLRQQLQLPQPPQRRALQGGPGRLQLGGRGLQGRQGGGKGHSYANRNYRIIPQRVEQGVPLAASAVGQHTGSRSDGSRRCARLAGATHSVAYGPRRCSTVPRSCPNHLPLVASVRQRVLGAAAGQVGREGQAGLRARSTKARQRDRLKPRGAYRCWACSSRTCRTHALEAHHTCPARGLKPCTEGRDQAQPACP